VKLATRDDKIIDKYPNPCQDFCHSVAKLARNKLAVFINNKPATKSIVMIRYWLRMNKVINYFKLIKYDENEMGYINGLNVGLSGIVCIGILDFD
jgi:hypothetical protein